MIKQSKTYFDIKCDFLDDAVYSLKSEQFSKLYTYLPLSDLEELCKNGNAHKVKYMVDKLSSKKTLIGHYAEESFAQLIFGAGPASLSGIVIYLAITNPETNVNKATEAITASVFCLAGLTASYLMSKHFTKGLKELKQYVTQANHILSFYPRDKPVKVEDKPRTYYKSYNFRAGGH